MNLSTFTQLNLTLDKTGILWKMTGLCICEEVWSARSHRERWILHQGVVPPFKGSSVGWRNGLTGAPGRWAKGGGNSYTLCTCTGLSAIDQKAEKEPGTRWTQDSNGPVQQRPAASWAPLGRVLPAAQRRGSFPATGKDTKTWGFLPHASAKSRLGKGFTSQSFWKFLFSSPGQAEDQNPKVLWNWTKIKPPGLG